ncbi:MAG TPA: NGG1p interacting factor NIF3 [Caldisericia bacterium]|mgnify:CR=1 FL=1|jgi:hypothetical protein|nr:NGG1p interacting factor NIF3 [bacterium]OQB75267.1 MAG: NIF3 (NGG1p interacting factor 3) [bacterium ADurb.Bin132]HNW32308.1 NGG1p interacting factor NIF3 [Caldisericia bacterium]HNY62012.1 NGG1p interacting factor NIF3 [Caldisericia bacterium]HOC79313.1 NGG1p interacting factor NIF3 [Caldisericia bacterium]
MNLESLYKLGVTIGIENDPRGKEGVQRDLELSKKTYEALKDSEKDYFDTVSLWNPYPDSRLQAVKDQDADIRELMVGIDIGTAELLLADKLKEKGTKIDAVLSHHPGGMGTVGLPKVMAMQADILALLGVPINIAEDIVSPRQKEVDQAIFAANHYATADAAKLLGITLFSLHTPADNCVVTFLDKTFKEKNPKTIEDLLKVISEIPEYDVAKRRGLPSKLEAGSPSKRCGKIAIDMTGGTTGSKDQYEALANAGVGTMVVMHIPKDHVEIAQKYHLNVINVGHMASDSLGMNIILDRFEQNGVKLTIMSGLIRINRNSGDPYADLRCPMPSSYIK